MTAWHNEMTDVEGSLVFENSRTDVEEPIRVEDQEEINAPTSSGSSTKIVVQPFSFKSM